VAKGKCRHPDCVQPGIFLTFYVGIPRRETVLVGPRPKMRMNKKSGDDLLEDWLCVIPVLFDDFPVRITVAAAGKSPSDATLD
jgi:hypothetical protein